MKTETKNEIQKNKKNEEYVPICSNLFPHVIICSRTLRHVPNPYESLGMPRNPKISLEIIRNLLGILRNP